MWERPDDARAAKDGMVTNMGNKQMTSEQTGMIDQSSWRQHAVTWMAVLFVVRLLWLIFNPLELVADEAYYWDWGRRPAWCYFSKPPMIAWVNSATQWLGLTSEWGVRLPALLCGTLTLWMLWQLARRMGDERSGWVAAVLGGLAPGAMVSSTLMTIDCLLLAAWSTCLYAVWRALEPLVEGSGNALRWRWWWLYALAGTLGVLSKQMMLVFPVLVLLFLWLTPHGRPWRHQWGIYFWLLVPLIGLIPVLLWNQAHGWITLQHTAHHFDAPAWSPLQAAQWIGDFLLSQCGVLGPVTTVMLLLAAGSIFRKRADAMDAPAVARQFMWLMCVPALVVMTVMSLRQEMNPNWPAVFLFGGVVLVALWLNAGWQKWRNWWKAAWLLGGLLMVLTYLLVLLIEPLGLQGSRIDLTKRLRGWSRAAAQVAEQQAQLERKVGKTIVVTVGSRKVASELAYYMPSRPMLWRWTPPGVVDSQYGLWDGPLPQQLGANALIVVATSDGTVPPGLASGFERLEKIGEIVTARGSDVPQRMTLWWGMYLAKWDHGRPLKVKR